MSRCHSTGGRERLLEALRRFMRVDVYGRCGDLECSHSGGWRSGATCYREMAQNYKFYFSFENSLCDEYVTEKLFNILHSKVIPVTFGSSDYARLAPPGSYINVMDFSSVRDLVDYLRMVHESDEKFASHLLIKDYYHIDKDNLFRLAFCQLCSKLHSSSEPPKSYGNLTKWWLDDSRCRTLRRVRGWEGRLDLGQWGQA